MSKGLFIGGGQNLSHKVSKLYLGNNDINSEVKKAYIGDNNGLAVECYSSGPDTIEIRFNIASRSLLPYLSGNNVRERTFTTEVSYIRVNLPCQVSSVVSYEGHLTADTRGVFDQYYFYSYNNSIKDWALMPDEEFLDRIDINNDEMNITFIGCTYNGAYSHGSKYIDRVKYINGFKLFRNDSGSGGQSSVTANVGAYIIVTLKVKK